MPPNQGAWKMPLSTRNHPELLFLTHTPISTSSSPRALSLRALSHQDDLALSQMQDILLGLRPFFLQGILYLFHVSLDPRLPLAVFCVRAVQAFCHFCVGHLHVPPGRWLTVSMLVFICCLLAELSLDQL